MTNNAFVINEQKWTKPLWSAGWTGIPSVRLHYQAQLGLDPVDLNILLQIIKHWWYDQNLPRPSKASIAKAIGRDPRTVQRHLAALEERGSIERIRRVNDEHGGQGANEYRLDGLIKAATPYAKEEKSRRDNRRKEDRSRRRKRAFKPKIIDGGNPPK